MEPPTDQPNKMSSMTQTLCIVSWIVAAYFGIGFIANAGFPPRRDILLGDALFVGLFLFFTFLPFFNKIKVGTWLELEREIKEAKKEVASAKEELREFKNEVRNTVSVISTNNVSPQFNVHMAGAEELRRQGEKVEERLNAKGRAESEEVKNELQADNDVNYALAKVRIDIERLLRVIVGNSLSVSAANRSPNFMSLSKMFELLVQGNDNFAYLRDPLKYVLSICNAAMHAQNLEPDQAQEALKLGAQIIAALKQHPGAAAAPV
jgi:multidrug efflux pump subunit AcrB